MKRFGITCSHFHPPEDEANLSRFGHYVDAVGDAGAGAEWLWIPEKGSPAAELNIHAERLALQLDGLILSGGADLPSTMFGEEDLAEAHIKPIVAERPSYEKLLIDQFLKRGKPVLGICYGCQLLNVLNGGTLLQDIPLQWKDPINHADGKHEVRVGAVGMLRDILRLDWFDATTSHHQAVKQAPSNAQVAADAPDGIIEAVVFSVEPFVVGVQWHPERDRGTPATERLFGALVEAA